MQKYELKKDGRNDGTKGDAFYKERVNAVRKSDSPFREVNKEIYKVTNLGI